MNGNLIRWATARGLTSPLDLPRRGRSFAVNFQTADEYDQRPHRCLNDSTPIVVADLLGLSPATAETWARYALDSWTHGRVRHPGQPQSGQCIDATGPSSADATRLQIWDSAGSANQKWALPADPPGGHRPTPGVRAGDSPPPAAGRDVLRYVAATGLLRGDGAERVEARRAGHTAASMSLVQGSVRGADLVTADA